MNNMDKKAIDTLRVLSMEQISYAASGHPGIALGASPIVYLLYQKILKVNPKNPSWPNRDRFILSAGHGSSLLYAALHMSGYDVKKEDLEQFRKLHSITPGHPELITPGVDAQTGPLGQGISMGVGMAIGEAHMASKFNKDIELVNHYTYVLCGDGDLQEGISQEAISIAGNLELDKLIVIYDSNDIQLDGNVSDANTEDTKAKMISQGWHYEKVEDGLNIDDLEEKIRICQKVNKPSLIEVKTVIGYGAKKQGTCDVHGAPLALDETKAMREKLGGEPYTISQDVLEYVKKHNDELVKNYTKVKAQEEQYAIKYPNEYKLYCDMINDNISFNISDIVYDEGYNKATRFTGGDLIRNIASQNPMIFGGAADLTKSTQAKCDDNNFTKTNRLGRNVCFGVREHAMAAICNGLSLYGGFRPFCSGFLVFSDYLKPAIRLSALMNKPVVYIFSHDTVAVGEDGPTHQPIEHLTMLRSIPNTNVYRPAFATEVKQVYDIAFKDKTTPSVIALTRQGVKEVKPLNKVCVEKGAYIIDSEENKLDLVLLATGSEVLLVMEVKEMLRSKNIDARVVSMPCTRLFDLQPKEYKNAVLPNGVKTIAIEASDATHLYKYSKNVVNITEFGVSASASVVLDYVGFTKEKLYAKVLEILDK